MKIITLQLQLDGIGALKLIEVLDQLRDAIAQRYQSDIVAEFCEPGGNQPELPFSEDLTINSDATGDPPF